MATAATIQSRLLSAENITYLNNFSVQYVNNDIEWNFNRTWPVVNVSQRSGQYYVYDDVRQNSPDNDIITEESAPNRVGSKFSKDSFTTEQYALRYFVTREMFETIGNPLDLTSHAASVVMGCLMAGGEMRFINKFFSANAGWANKVTGVDASPDYSTGKVLKWSDTASTPLEDIAHFTRQYKLLSRGHKANAAIMSDDVFYALINHPDIAPRLTPSGQDPRSIEVLKNMLATLLNLPYLRVIDSIHNVAKDGITDENGNQPEDFQFMTSGMFFIYNYTPTAGLRTDAPAVTFNYRSGAVGYNGGYPTFKTYPHWDAGIPGVFIEGRFMYGQQIANKRNGILFTGLI